MRISSGYVVITSSFLLWGTIAVLAAKTADIETTIQGDVLSLPPAAKETLQQWVRGVEGGDPPNINHPKEVISVIDAVSSCDVVLDGWDKAAFLQDWKTGEMNLRQKLARLVDDGKRLKVGPPISPALAAKMIADTQGDQSLSRETLEMLKRFEQAGIEVSRIEFEGIPGPWVKDASVDALKSVPSAEQIGIAAERFLRVTLPNLYGGFALTPEGCYSPEGLLQVRTVIKTSYQTEELVAKIFDDVDLEQIECGKVNTYSRFRVPARDLSEPVIAALATGPWPFGPAGYYFDRNWFYVNAAWQMYARENGDYYKNLSADVTDYTCGKP